MKDKFTFKSYDNGMGLVNLQQEYSYTKYK